MQDPSEKPIITSVLLVLGLLALALGVGVVGYFTLVKHKPPRPPVAQSTATPAASASAPASDDTQPKAGASLAEYDGRWVDQNGVEMRIRAGRESLEVTYLDLEDREFTPQDQVFIFSPDGGRSHQQIYLDKADRLHFFTFADEASNNVTLVRQ